MKAAEKPKEFPIIPKIPEVEPGRDIPTPEIQPEFPDQPIPTEKPKKNPIPEIVPPKENINLNYK